MPVVAQPPLTDEEYLRRDLDAEGRLELLDGTLTDVAGAKPEHNQIKDKHCCAAGCNRVAAGCYRLTSASAAGRTSTSTRMWSPRAFHT